MSSTRALTASADSAGAVLQRAELGGGPGQQVAGEPQAVARCALVSGVRCDRLGAGAQVSQRLTEVRKQTGLVADGESVQRRAVSHSIARDGEKEVLKTFGCGGHLCAEQGCRMFSHR
jgi:hypothetical protein